VGKIALITGVTGQDGACLAEFLLARGYRVHGLTRRPAEAGGGRLAHLHPGPPGSGAPLQLHFGDLLDGPGLERLIRRLRPDEIYNLAAQSHVHLSFEVPEHTAEVGGLGTLRLLEGVRAAGLVATVRFYQASTSELFGDAAEAPQRESTPFAPVSPYAAAKQFAHAMTGIYRRAYGLFACNGILFNHEGPTRGTAFVTRRITRAVAAIHHGLARRLTLGNLEARRDWGHVRDYVEGMWLMLQQPVPDDYVLATGRSHSVRDFVEAAFAEIGRELVWRGHGLEERGHDAHTGEVLVEVDPALFRPAEVWRLVGDAAKARARLGWTPRTGFAELVREMVACDLAVLGDRSPAVPAEGGIPPVLRTVQAPEEGIPHS
jgi:GDPmannose 4,6-dehydratase